MIDGFDLKPDNCYDRLLQMILDGAKADTIPQAIEDLRSMAHEVAKLGELKFHLKDM